MDDKWRESAPVSDIEASSWIRIFRAFDTDHDGFINCEEMQKTIRDNTYSFGFDHYELQKMSLYLEMRDGKPIDFADFCYLMSKCKGYRLREFLFKCAVTVTPQSQRVSVFSQLQKYQCFPPPLFLIFLSILQLVFYIFYVIDSGEGIWLNGPLPTISPLIINPHHFGELWRYFTYFLINVGLFHTFFNIFIQLIIGLPLEIVYSWRIYCLYFAGIIFGSLLTMALDPTIILCGGGSGSFAILFQHMTTLILNLRTMDKAVIRLSLFSIFGLFDFGFAFYQRFYSPHTDKVSIYGHIGGMIAGILFNFILLRGSKPTRLFTILFWFSIVFVAFYFAVCFALIIAPNLNH